MTTREEAIDYIVESLIKLILEPEKITKNLEEKLTIVIERIESLENKIINLEKKENEDEKEKGALSWF